MLDTLDIMTIGYQDMPDILYSLVRLDKLDTHARDHGMNSLSFLLNIVLTKLCVVLMYFQCEHSLSSKSENVLSNISKR